QLVIEKKIADAEEKGRHIQQNYLNEVTPGDETRLWYDRENKERRAKDKITACYHNDNLYLIEYEAGRQDKGEGKTQGYYRAVPRYDKTKRQDDDSLNYKGQSWMPRLLPQVHPE
nr:hypothetical protein [Chloroflexota bacterium]